MGTLKICSWLFFTFLFSILSLMHVVYVTCQCLESERYHLLQLKAGLKVLDDGQYSDEKHVTWSNQSWDCCLWSGVGCSEDGKVISLDLSGQGITGVNDSSILFSLKYLERLNLAENRFNSTFPAKFDELSNLNYLNLSDSGFSGQIPIGISRLKNLRTLHISSYRSSLLENPNLDTIIRNLSNLQELLLGGVYILAKDGNWGRAISSSLPNLQLLRLYDCDLKGSNELFPNSLQNLSYLDLSHNSFSGPFPDFSSLPKLKSLYMSLNEFNGPFPNSHLKCENLSYLDLSYNSFSGPLPDFSSLQKLETLDLSSNKFNGPFPNSLLKCENLVNLDLSYNNFSGPLPDFSSLQKLKSLDLFSNKFNEYFPNSLLKCENLSYLELSFNSFSGPLPDFSSLEKLEMLHLAMNKFNEPFPNSLSKCENLVNIDLSYNNFNGPLSDFSSLQKLLGLHLSFNKFNGHLPNSLHKCENLIYLGLSYNNFSGIFYSSMINHFQLLEEIDISYSGFSFVDDRIDVPSSLPYLQSVQLVSCGLRSFPGFLRNSSNLFDLDLSMNQISGEIPNWIWEVKLNLLNLSHNFLEDMGRPLHVPSIRDLDLHSNRLQGELSFFPTNVWYLDYSMNNFSSSIPNLIPGSSIYFFSLSNNNFNGSIPESFCNLSGIHVLDLSNNSLTGSIPQCISMLMKESLVVFNMGMNNLNGTISDALFQVGCQLETLDLNGNRLSGKIPKSMANCKRLQVLNLGNNEIHDTFPCWLKEISNLSVLVLHSNNFHGELGCPETKATWPMLQIVDLSSNSFRGKLSAEWFLLWKGMMVVTRSTSILNAGRYYQDVVTINLKGSELKLEKILNIFTCIDLSSNKFEGSIPQELGDLIALLGLNMSGNNFRGQIPASLGSLKQLESLDLSKNKLNGSIPQQLADLDFLQVLNLSFNQLEGRIPKGSQFDNLCEDSFLGNKGLVGPQVNRKCKDDGKTAPSPPTSSHDNNTSSMKSEVRWELIGAEVGFTCGLGFVMGSLLFWQRWRKWYFDRVDQVLLKIQCHHNQRTPNQLRRKGGK